MRRLFGSILVASALTAVPGGATAADGGPVLITAYACAELPSPLEVEIDVEEDSEHYRALREVLVAALAASPARVRKQAPLRLSLYLETQRESERRKGRDLGQFSRGNAYDERTKFRMNLWSNRQDSVFGGRKDAVTQQAVNELLVAIAIHDMRNGRCVWQGEAKYHLDEADEFRIAERVIPMLTRQLGRTVRGQSLTLD